jgi:peptide deformylase
MAIRTILHYPDKRLRIPGKPVERFDDELRALVDDMAETMYAAPGVGLAAPQIGVSLRLFVVDVAVADDAPSDLRTFINPEFIEQVGTSSYEEGCLSFPGIHESIERAERVRVRAQDVTGQPFELEADGLLAIAIQHEHDHLDGKLLVDRLSLLRRRLVHRAMLKRASPDEAFGSG